MQWLLILGAFLLGGFIGIVVMAVLSAAAREDERIERAHYRK